MQSSISEAYCFPPHVPGMCYLSVKLLALIQKSSKVAMNLYMHACTQFSLQHSFYLGCCFSLNLMGEDALFFPTE